MFITRGNMGSSDRPQAGPESGIPAAARAGALDAVQGALRWQLAEARWPAIDETLVAMEAACQAGDWEGLEEATIHLELAGPLRLIRIGATPIVSAPLPIHDRLNNLVFALGGTTLAAQPQATEDNGSGNDAPRRS